MNPNQTAPKEGLGSYCLQYSCHEWNERHAGLPSSYIFQNKAVSRINISMSNSLDQIGNDVMLGLIII